MCAYAPPADAARLHRDRARANRAWTPPGLLALVHRANALLILDNSTAAKPSSRP